MYNQFVIFVTFHILQGKEAVIKNNVNIFSNYLTNFTV